MQKAYCNSCKQTTKCAIRAANFTTTVEGIDYHYIGKEARCTVCGKIIKIPEIDEFNIKSFNDAYQRQATEMMQHCLDAPTVKPLRKDSYQIFAELLEQHKTTSYRVAKGTGIKQTTFSNWKHGRSTPNLETLWRLSEYFQVTINYFLNDDDISNNRTAANVAFERLKQGLLEYDFNENDVDFLIDVYKAHKSQEKNRKK